MTVPAHTLFVTAAITALLAAPAQASRHRQEPVAPNCEQPATPHEERCCLYPGFCRSYGFSQPSKADAAKVQKEYYEEQLERKMNKTANTANTDKMTPDVQASIEASRKKLKCRKAQTVTERQCCDSGDPELCHRLGFKTPNEFSEKGKLAAQAGTVESGPQLVDPKCEVMSLANMNCCERRTEEYCEPYGFTTPE